MVALVGSSGSWHYTQCRPGVILALVPCCSSSLAGGTVAKERDARQFVAGGTFFASIPPPTPPSIAPSASQSSELLTVGHTCGFRAFQVPPPPRKSLSRPLELPAIHDRSPHLMPVVQISGHNFVRQCIGSDALTGYSLAPTNKNKGRIVPTSLICSHGPHKRLIDDSSALLESQAITVKRGQVRKGCMVRDGSPRRNVYISTYPRLR